MESLRERIEGIVIGASAGGVDALAVLLPALPLDLRAAVFVTIHLPRERPSLLVEIFQSRCSVRVKEAEDKEMASPGVVYFAPPDYHLLIEEGPQLALSVDEPVHFSRPSVDVLFQSAADVYRERLLGIILTSANEDGADGLAGIHAAGGVTLVQRPESAQASRMVISAMSRSPVDFVLTLEQIALLLSTLGRNLPATGLAGAGG